MLIFDPRNPREWLNNYGHRIYDVVIEVDYRGEDSEIYKCWIEEDPGELFTRYQPEKRDYIYVEEEDVTYAPRQLEEIKSSLNIMKEEIDV